MRALLISLSAVAAVTVLSGCEADLVKNPDDYNTALPPSPKPEPRR